jgi:hypothetical protein
MQLQHSSIRRRLVERVYAPSAHPPVSHPLPRPTANTYTSICHHDRPTGNGAQRERMPTPHQTVAPYRTGPNGAGTPAGTRGSATKRHEPGVRLHWRYGVRTPGSPLIQKMAPGIFPRHAAFAYVGLRAVYRLVYRSSCLHLVSVGSQRKIRDKFSANRRASHKLNDGSKA